MSSPVDAEVRVDLAHVREGAASREECGEGGDAGQDARLQPRGYLRTVTPIPCPEEQEAGAPDPSPEEEERWAGRRRHEPRPGAAGDLPPSTAAA